MELKLEVFIVPVSDLGRTRAFYEKLDFRVDHDGRDEKGFGALQLTPPGSMTSIIASNALTSEAAGPLEGLYLIVDDVEATRADIASRGVEISEVFHEAQGGIPSVNKEGRIPGLAPERASYFSFATFSDPEGNEWILQEITTRFPGRV